MPPRHNPKDHSWQHHDRKAKSKAGKISKPMMKASEMLAMMAPSIQTQAPPNTPPLEPNPMLGQTPSGPTPDTATPVMGPPTAPSPSLDIPLKGRRRME